MKKAALHNLGCKVNAYETEAMQEMLEKAGYEIVPFKEGADLYVINTCTVTNIADRKSRQMLHRARKMNPDAVVVAAGCYVQAKEKEIQVDDCIDIVLGNNKKQNLIEALEEYERTHNADCNVTENEKNAKNQENDRKAEIKMEEIGKTKEYENLHLTKPGDHTRAYIKVQDGCNQFCTYCIIPYARGRVRSRSMEDVLDEVRTLADNGYKEVVLTGIHLSSYGIDFDKEYHLLELIRAVHEIDGIEKDLKDFGIKKGTNKKDVELDNVANEIRLKRDDISWIGINIKGTNLIVNIVKADDKPEIVDNNDFCNIVSAKSGVVEKVIAQNGTPLVKKGDNIQKGDILIAGYMEGKYTERRLVHSQGEVQARIFYTKTQKIPLHPQIFEPTGQNEKKFQNS